MATTDVPIWNGLPEDSQLAAKRSFKPADLPITPSQRTSLDALVNTLKRKGEFDALRKRVWADFSEGVHSSVDTCPVANIDNFYRTPETFLRHRFRN